MECFTRHQKIKIVEGGNHGPVLPPPASTNALIDSTVAGGNAASNEAVGITKSTPLTVETTK
jgi:hypothetical protein